MIDEALVLLLHVYVHSSKGHPGFDAGTGWFQPARIAITGASIFPENPKLPVEISGGTVRIGNDTYPNSMPATGTFRTTVALDLELITGKSLSIRGDGVAIELHGTRSSIEDFSGF